MARIRNKSNYASPGLFDDFEPGPRSAAAAPLPSDSRLRFMSFGSGSSGNCAYIGDDSGGILIDAGVELDKVLEALGRYGIGLSQIHALLLTHDHGDHVRYAYTYLRQHRYARVYCTPRVLGGLLRRHSISRRIKDYHEPIHKEIPFTVGRFRVTAFDVSHDGTDNAGFFIEYGAHRFAVATDLGEIGSRAAHYLSQANYMMIEANYDAEMLIRGRYPEYLKARIMARSGHLDNVETASFVSELAAQPQSPLRYVFLCHLSNDNNTPKLAESVVRAAIEARGVAVGDCSDSLEARDARVQLMALPRYAPTRLFLLRAPEEPSSQG